MDKTNLKPMYEAVADVQSELNAESIN